MISELEETNFKQKEMIEKLQIVSEETVSRYEKEIKEEKLLYQKTIEMNAEEKKILLEQLKQKNEISVETESTSQNYTSLNKNRVVSIFNQ